MIEACFSSTTALVGVTACGLMRATFDLALDFCRIQRRGGLLPVIEHPASVYQAYVREVSR